MARDLMDEDDDLPVCLLSDFLVQSQSEEIHRILIDAGEPDDPVVMPVNLLRLADHNPELAENLIRRPQWGIARLQEAAVSAQQELLEGMCNDQECTIKQNLRVRLTGLPVGHNVGHVGPQIGSICARHVDSLVITRGTVTHAGSAKVLERERHYECLSCGTQFVVAASLEAGFTVQTPFHCPSNQTKPCKGKSFRHKTEMQTMSDYQEIRLQHKASGASTAARSPYIGVLLEDELADSCQPGDDVIVTAVVRQRWRPVIPGLRCEVDLCLHANSLVVLNSRKAHIEVTPESVQKFKEFWEEHAGRPLVGRDKILAMICPQLHGMSLVKLAVAMLLVGGAPQWTSPGVHARSDIHLLLVGDPGIGKSQFLQFAAKASSRSVLTSGRGSSAAGLTASAVRSGQDWSLEAGAMVLADGGVCCIDEFNGLKDGAQTVILEAMEQQTVSVAKAGILTSLNTRAAVLAACNPKGRYDSRISLSANTKIGSALLSRFDIVLVLRDMRIPTWDATIADHLLGLGSDSLPKPDCLDWDVEVFKQYISWAKTFEVTMTPEAEKVLLAYYQHQRQMAMQDSSRTTTRMLQSLLRISQAHARLLAKPEVSQQDAVMAVLLVDAFRVDEGLLDINPMMDFNSEDPDGDFSLLSHQILTKIGLASKHASSPGCKFY